MNQEHIQATIITIGDELLIGQTIDTNSSWIARELNKMGIFVQRRIAVGDQKEAIWNALSEEGKRNSIILITGGLGPTSDDITKPLLCAYFNTTLKTDPAVLEHVKSIFQRRNRPLLAINLAQAEVPSNCRVLFNEAGTAPGMWFEKDEVIYISMPGVPMEMQHIMNMRVLPELKKRFQLPEIIHRTLVTAGEGESFIASQLTEFEKALPKQVRLAYLPKLGGVKLRLSGSEKDLDLIDSNFNTLKDVLKRITIADSDIETEQAIFQLLKQANKTMALAESCTGGRLSQMMTSMSGASSVFIGGFITYSAAMKIDLGVPPDTIEHHGVISQETAKAMAEACKNRTGADFSMAITGHLEKQETETYAWIAVCSRHHQEEFKVKAFYDREKNAVFYSNTALYILHRFILMHLTA